jgi:DNA (cytosine-5)-methyltransferase 1
MTLLSNTTLDADVLADVVSVSKSIIEKWESSGRITPVINEYGRKSYPVQQLELFQKYKPCCNPHGMLTPPYSQFVTLPP